MCCRLQRHDTQRNAHHETASTRARNHTRRAEAAKRIRNARSRSAAVRVTQVWRRCNGTHVPGTSTWHGICVTVLPAAKASWHTTHVGLAAAALRLAHTCAETPTRVASPLPPLPPPPPAGAGGGATRCRRMLHTRTRCTPGTPILTRRRSPRVSRASRIHHTAQGT
jgi:hypothetical protein